MRYSLSAMSMFANAGRLAALTRVLVRTCGKNALKRSLPLYLTVGIVAFVLFAGNGLDAATITKFAVQYPLFRWCASMVWLIASLPAARALLASPETFFVRALPVRLGHILLLFGAALAIVHVPWWVLWARGAGAGAAAGATLSVLGIQMAVLAGVRTPADAAVWAIALASFAFPPSLASAALGVSAFVPGLRQAWIRAPEPPWVGHHALLTHNRALSMMSAWAISVVRGHRPVVFRATLLALAAGALNVLGLRNNAVIDVSVVTAITLMVWAPACVFGAVGVAGPVLDAERKARWLLDVCGVSPTARCVSAAALLATWSAACGLLYGVLVGATLGLDHAHIAWLGAHCVSGGAAWGALAVAVVRLTDRGRGGEAGRLLLAVLGLVVGSTAMLALHPTAAVGILLLAAAPLSAAAAREPRGARAFRRAA